VDYDNNDPDTWESHPGVRQWRQMYEDEKAKKTLKRILVVDEKHGYRYFDAGTEEALHASALKLVTERVEDGYWYDDEAQQIAERITKKQDGNAAWGFILRRSNSKHEYETVRLENLE